MGVRFNTLKVGDVLYYTFRKQVGHTTMLEDAHRAIKIIEIDVDAKKFKYSSRGEIRTANASKLANWRRSKPQYREAITGRKIRIKKETKGRVANGIGI